MPAGGRSTGHCLQAVWRRPRGFPSRRPIFHGSTRPRGTRCTLPAPSRRCAPKKLGEGSWRGGPTPRAWAPALVLLTAQWRDAPGAFPGPATEAGGWCRESGRPSWGAVAGGGPASQAMMGAARSRDPAWPRAEAQGPQTKGTSRRPGFRATEGLLEEEPGQSWMGWWSVWGGRTQEARSQGRAALGGGAAHKGRGPGRFRGGVAKIHEVAMFSTVVGVLGALLRASSCHGRPVWVCPPPWAWVPRIAARWVFWGVREQAWAWAMGVVTQRAGTCCHPESWTSRAMRIRADRAGCGMFWGLPPGSRALAPPASSCEPSSCSAVGGGRGRWGLGRSQPVLPCAITDAQRVHPRLPPTPARLPSQRSTLAPPLAGPLCRGITVTSERKQKSQSLLTVASAGAAASPLTGVRSQGAEHFVSHLRAPAGPASCRDPTERLQGC